MTDNKDSNKQEKEKKCDHEYDYYDFICIHCGEKQKNDCKEPTKEEKTCHCGQRMEYYEIPNRRWLCSGCMKRESACECFTFQAEENTK